MTVTTPPPHTIVPLRNCGASSRPVFFPVRVAVPDILVHENASRYDAGFAAHLARDVYGDRIAACDQVDVVDLPKDTVVDGRSFLALSDGKWVQEQCHPMQLSTPDHVAALQSGAVSGFWAGIAVEDVAEPCLLVARYGETTWGHWIGELLPRAIAAEHVSPGRFRFAIPAYLEEDRYGAAMRRNVLASFAAYGIGAERLLRLSPSLLYRFASLSAVTSVWTQPLMMHPDMLDLMRLSVRRLPAHRSRERLFIRRSPAMGRTLANEPDILALAERRGYVPVSIPDLSFGEQVSLFSNASKIVAVLGSDLGGLIYAPDGIGVVSLAPSTWGDRFFSALIQQRDGRYADVRGTPVATGSLHRMPFVVSPQAFEAALDAIDRAPA